MQFATVLEHALRRPHERHASAARSTAFSGASARRSRCATSCARADPRAGGHAGDARRRARPLPRLRLAAPARRDGARGAPPARRLRIDARPPASLLPQARAQRSRPRRPSATVAAKIAPLELAVRDDAPRRINLLIPTIDLRALLRRLHREAEPGRATRRARRASPDRDRRSGRRAALVLAQHAGGATAGCAGLFDTGRGRLRPRVAGRRGQPLRPLHRHDLVDGAHRARRALAPARRRPLSLPDPGVRAVHVPDGDLRRAGERVLPLSPLRALLHRAAARLLPPSRDRGLRGRARPPATRRRPRSRTRSPRSIRRRAAELAGRGTRRLLFYARPEPHAARNMFELGVLALEPGASRRAPSGRLGAARDRHRRLAPAHDARRAGRSSNLLPRREQGGYAELLREHDVGLALMYTPHPSLVPIEMASAGMLTVTNSFENKTAEAMAAISPNLITVEPDLDGARGGAAARPRARPGTSSAARGAAASRWSRDWDQSFDDAPDGAGDGRSSTAERPSELLGDPRRLAPEDPHREHADRRRRWRSAAASPSHAAGGVDRAGGARVDDPDAAPARTAARAGSAARNVLQRLGHAPRAGTGRACA